MKDVQDVVSKTTLPTESLHDQQLALEEESQRTGIHAYRKAEARRREKGLEAITGPVAHLVRVYLEPLGTGILEWTIERASRPGRHALAVPVLKEVDPDVAALIALRIPVLGQINEMMVDPNKSPSEKTAELNDLITRGQVSYNDAARFQGMVMSLGRVTRDSAGLTLHRYLEDTKNSLYNAALLDPDFADQRMLAQALGGSASLPEEIKNQIESKALAITAAFERYMAANPQPLLSALEAELQKAQQQVLGPQLQDTNTSQVAGAVINAHNDPVGFIQSGRMTWVKDHFEVRAGETSVPISTPRIFKNAGELTQNWKAAAQEIGIASPDEQADFLDKQITAMGLGPEETRKVFEQFKEDLWGPDVVKQASNMAKTLDDLYKSYSTLVTNHEDALSKGLKNVAVGWGGIAGGWQRTLPREAIAEYRKAINAIAVLQQQIGTLSEGPADVSAVQTAITALQARLSSLTPDGGANRLPSFTR